MTFVNVWWGYLGFLGTEFRYMFLFFINCRFVVFRRGAIKFKYCISNFKNIFLYSTQIEN